ncbi:magnesium transporter CorA family protein [Mesobacillus subterraneus]|uniref:Mg2+ transporter protein, CorA-like protein n=1 Tax=Mesobacillus subterraneus TaxID=285983 RepID=A0A3R9FWF3_9BACI|nr:magnesium transporter CorA family protein [Mesobacillus subterraneus]RSD26732.1 Mg2+ transporter protein, CorA-like protein [Mesobacillus subterraneus]
MQYTFNQDQWAWYDFKEGQEVELKGLLEKFPACHSWYEDVKENKSNFLELNTQTRGKEYIWGSLVYQQDIDKKEDKKVFHFYISKEFFITFNFDFNIPESDKAGVHGQMEQAEDGVEGFFVLLGEILLSYLNRIDGYEENLHELLWKMKERNNLQLLEKVYENRHELLVWKNLLIPITELKFIAREAYGEEIRKKPEYSRVDTRVNRARMLIEEYQQEIDTMIRLEEVVSTHRGNEIMKTLTVMTVLFTPVMAWGALWGMNFKIMPELEWQLGYLFAGILILVSTLGLYLYLRKKGWMGDILKGKKKDSFFE